MKRFFIYWRKDMPKKNGLYFANVHLLVGYNDGTIASYQKMAEELRKTFPEAEDGEIHCSKIEGSSHYNGFSLITWSTFLPEGKYKGWHQFEGCPDYHWN